MATATKTTTKAKPKKAAASKEGAFAVLETGNKQYLVREGDTIKIEKLLDKDYAIGDKITFDSVLLTDDGSKTAIDAGALKSAKITGEVLDAGKAKKITVIHYRQKSRYFKKNGHRQHFLKVKITALK